MYLLYKEKINAKRQKGVRDHVAQRMINWHPDLARTRRVRLEAKEVRDHVAK